MPVILATWKAKIGRIEVGGQPREKVIETPFQTIAEHSVMHRSPPLCGRLRSGGSRFQVSMGKKVCKTPSQPKTKNKTKKTAHSYHLSNGGKCKLGGSRSNLAWTQSETPPSPK
jgi:hypothetical protein